MPGEPWAPGLADVARHVPRRTRDKTKPSSDVLLGTFNANTTPTDSAVQQLIDDTVAGLQAVVGDVPNVVDLNPDLAAALRTFVEWRVAADIELSYPNRDADVQVAQQLDARATAAFTVVTQALATTGGGAIDVLPIWGFPDPPPYADQSPGSGIDFIVKPVIPSG